MISPSAPVTQPQVSAAREAVTAPGVNSSVAASHPPFYPLAKQTALYDRLVDEFDWLAERLGGWNTTDGTALDGMLWKLSHEVAGS